MKNENLLNNLIVERKNIKRKIMDIKRGVIVSDNYFRETFKLIIDPLKPIVEKKVGDDYREISPTSDVDENQFSTSFSNFFKIQLKLRRYDTL